MADTLITLDDEQVLDRLGELAHTDAASLAQRYDPATIARIMRWMSLEMRLRALPRQDPLPPDFAFKVAERAGVVEANGGVERGVAAAGIAIMTGGGVGALAWMSRLGDFMDVVSFTGLQVGGVSSLMTPLVVGAAVIGFYSTMDRHLPHWLRRD